MHSFADDGVGVQSRTTVQHKLDGCSSDLRVRYKGATSLVWDDDLGKDVKQVLYERQSMYDASSSAIFVDECNITIGGVQFPFLQRCEGTADPCTGVTDCCPGHFIFDHRYQHNRIGVFEHTVPVAALRKFLGKYIRKCFDSGLNLTKEELLAFVPSSATWSMIADRLTARPWFVFRCWQCNHKMHEIRARIEKLIDKGILDLVDPSDEKPPDSDHDQSDSASDSD